MRRELNPELDRKILDALAEKYHMLDKREGIHLSTLIGCLTRSYLDLKAPVELTDTELLLFSTGYGLQEVMTPSSAEAPLIEVEGISYRPDNVLRVEGEYGFDLIEMKSTRAGVKRYQTGDLPDGWITYMKAGCHMMQCTEYNLIVIYVSERPTAKIISETLYFEPEEIKENWLYIQDRRDDYQHFLATDTVPPPRQYCKEWECKNCRYMLQCDAIVMLERAEKDKKELWPE